jgi:hypothetical protein
MDDDFNTQVADKEERQGARRARVEARAVMSQE